MYDISPVLPFHILLLYLTVTTVALSLCVLTFIAVYKTKRTPYPTKLFSLGLIFYDCLFLVTAFGAKFVTFEDGITFRFFFRGFQIAGGGIIVCSMAVERLFILKWPYIYIRLGTKRRTRKVCISIIVLAFLQYLLFRLLMCNARGRTTSCSVPMGAYFALILISCLGVSIVSYVKIYALIRKTATKMTSLSHYKGTRASFLFLVNSTVTFTVYMALSAYLAVGVSTEDIEKQTQVSNIVDFAYVLNCIFDPLVYAIWFKEVQMEILKIFSPFCPCLKPSVEKMRLYVFSIDLNFANVKRDKNEP